MGLLFIDYSSAMQSSIGEQAWLFLLVFLFFRLPKLFRRPAIATQIATPTRIKLHAFSLEHPLLFVRRQDDATRRASALRIDDTLPGCRLFIRRVHDEA